MKRKLSNIYTPYVFLFFMLIYCFCLFFNTDAKTEEIISSPLSPVKVIDGDSLEIGSNRIRLIGIDAPEYNQYCKNKNKKNYPCGQNSFKHLKKIIKESPVKCIAHQKDKYNRDLCTCYVNEMDINREMVLSGHAIAYMESNYQKEQEQAKKAKRGIWQGKFIHPRLFRRLRGEK